MKLLLCIHGTIATPSFFMRFKQEHWYCNPVSSPVSHHPKSYLQLNGIDCLCPFLTWKKMVKTGRKWGKTFHTMSLIIWRTVRLNLTAIKSSTAISYEMVLQKCIMGSPNYTITKNPELTWLLSVNMKTTAETHAHLDFVTFILL